MAFPKPEIGRRIREVREQLAVPREEMAAACGVDVLLIERLEEGTLDPVPGDYILIAARLLKTDFRYFISTALDDIEDETRQVYRALAEPTPDDLLAIRRFILFCTSEAELETLLEVTHPSLPAYPRPGAPEKLQKAQGTRAALEERKRMRIGNSPIANIFDLLRKQGVRVFRYKLADSRLSGVTVMHPRAGVSVLLNYDDDLYRQFFSAAHEYAHVLFDREEVSSSGCVVSYRFQKKRLIEIRANAFAAEFMLPADALTRYPRPRDMKELSKAIRDIARDYHVNTETVAIRLKEQGWISDRTLSSFRKIKPVVIRRSEKSDPDIPPALTQNQREYMARRIQHGISPYYLDLLRRGLTEHKISEGRFAEMLDMTLMDAREFAASIGMAWA